MRYLSGPVIRVSQIPDMNTLGIPPWSKTYMSRIVLAVAILLAGSGFVEAKFGPAMKQSPCMLKSTAKGLNCPNMK